ncbi:MAG: hypothetical protein PHV93_04240 [Candidatus Pacebacteria bacterium]|nr:hypothetical protein [Candidatus Paceibacterota bacterium]
MASVEVPDPNEEIKRVSFEVPPEYHFDEGLLHITEKIEALLDSGSKYVTVAIGGLSHDDIDIGKTTLSAAIIRHFTAKDIPVYSVPAPGDLAIEGLVTLQKLIRDSGKENAGGIILFNAWHTLVVPPAKMATAGSNQETILKKHAERVNLPIEKIDLKIGLYRPDRPYAKKNSRNETVFPLADIVICNEKAIDKGEVEY